MPAKILPTYFQKISEIESLVNKKWFDGEELDEKCSDLVKLLEANNFLIFTLFDNIIELLNILKDKKFLDNGNYLISEISEIFYDLPIETILRSQESERIVTNLVKIEAEYTAEALLTGEIY